MTVAIVALAWVAFAAVVQAWMWAGLSASNWWAYGVRMIPVAVLATIWAALLPWFGIGWSALLLYGACVVLMGMAAIFIANTCEVKVRQFGVLVPTAPLTLAVMVGLVMSGVKVNAG